jgi:hypothetical protein
MFSGQYATGLAFLVTYPIWLHEVKDLEYSYKAHFHHTIGKLSCLCGTRCGEMKVFEKLL